MDLHDEPSELDTVCGEGQGLWVGVDDAREGEEDTGEKAAAGVWEIRELMWMGKSIKTNIRGTNM